MAGHHLDLVVIEPSTPGMDVMKGLLDNSPDLPIIINTADECLDKSSAPAYARASRGH